MLEANYPFCRLHHQHFRVSLSTVRLNGSAAQLTPAVAAPPEHRPIVVHRNGEVGTASCKKVMTKKTNEIKKLNKKLTSMADDVL